MIQTKNTLKGYFLTGEKPSQDNFNDLIDTLATENDLTDGLNSMTLEVVTSNGNTTTNGILLLNSTLQLANDQDFKTIDIYPGTSTETDTKIVLVGANNPNAYIDVSIPYDITEDVSLKVSPSSIEMYNGATQTAGLYGESLFIGSNTGLNAFEIDINDDASSIVMKDGLNVGKLTLNWAPTQENIQSFQDASGTIALVEYGKVMFKTNLDFQTGTTFVLVKPTLATFCITNITLITESLGMAGDSVTFNIQSNGAAAIFTPIVNTTTIHMTTQAPWINNLVLNPTGIPALIVGNMASIIVTANSAKPWSAKIVVEGYYDL